MGSTRASAICGPQRHSASGTKTMLPCVTRAHAAQALSRLLVVVLALALCVLAGCAGVPAHNPLAVWRPSPNFDARRASMIVLHFTREADVADALRTLRAANVPKPVSAHYVVGKDGTIYQLVAEDERAWHAGASWWAGTDDVNSRSIGIELDNNGEQPFPPVQIDALLRLLADVTTRLQIPPTAVVGHADVAPTRRDDPGVRFPWRELAAHGFGLWYDPGPLPDPPPGFDPMAALRMMGYGLSDPRATIVAYHRHFRANSAPALDAFDDRILWNLACKAMREGGFASEPGLRVPAPVALVRGQCRRPWPLRVQ